MNDIMIDIRSNQYDEDMLIEEISVSDAYSVWLRETSNALACKKC